MAPRTATTATGMRAEDALGRRGEDIAAWFLEQRGLVLLNRNWRCRDGELDIVATDGSRLVVAEVKTRSGSDFGTPAEAVTPAKAARIRRLASVWLSANRVGWCEVRFDVVAVLCPAGGEVRVEHLEGVF